MYFSLALEERLARAEAPDGSAGEQGDGRADAEEREVGLAMKDWRIVCKIAL